jgi:hypothetical protein
MNPPSPTSKSGRPRVSSARTPNAAMNRAGFGKKRHLPWTAGHTVAPWSVAMGQPWPRVPIGFPAAHSAPRSADIARVAYGCIIESEIW